MWRPMTYSACSAKSSVSFEDSSLLPNLAQLLDGARKEFDADREVAKALLTRATSLLRIELERQSIDPGQDRKSGGLAAWQIRRLNVYIDTKLDQPILLKELSAVAKLSVAYFCRAFRRTFQEAPHAYVVRKRLERAESLMLTSDLSLSDVALRCGFTDQAHLCKLFRVRHAQTPAAWRRERSEGSIRKSIAPSRQEGVIELC
jgi:AraC family transcriptional regulator